MTPLEKRRVRAVAYNAMRAGRLPKQPCLDCGTVERVEAHHPRGYDSPLDVEWLCKTHHMALHRHPISEESLLAALRTTRSPVKAARLLGVSRETVNRRMRQYDIKRTYERAAQAEPRRHSA